MSHRQARGIMTSGASRKRKEIASSFCSFHEPLAPPAADTARTSSEPESSNLLLAGYMAHEFLTNGTLFGQNFEPALAKAVPLHSGSTFEQKRLRPEAEQAAKKGYHQSYADVACVLNADGTHVPGVVNPTQLARWIQM